MCGSQIHDPLAHLGRRLGRGQGELGTLAFGGGLGFGRAERGVGLTGVAAAEFSVGGDGELSLGAGGGIPVRAVGHGGGEDGLALPVGLAQSLVAGREFLLARGGAGVAAVPGGGGFGGGVQASQAGLPGGGADLAELIPYPCGRPGRLNRVGVAQVQEPARSP